MRQILGMLQPTDGMGLKLFLQCCWLRFRVLVELTLQGLAVSRGRVSEVIAGHSLLIHISP